MTREQRIQELLNLTSGTLANETANFVGVMYTSGITIDVLQSIYDVQFTLTTADNGYAVFQDIGGA